MVNALFVFLAMWLVDVSHSICWDTGCQPHSWAVKGCKVSGRGAVERNRRACANGFVYMCCTGSETDGDGSDVNGGGGDGSGGSLGKRGYLTHYYLGQTACGHVHSNKEVVAAIAPGHFTSANPNNDPMCGRRARIVDPRSNKQITVTIIDRCGTCKMNDIDVSTAAFRLLRPLGVGRFQVTWDFV